MSHTSTSHQADDLDSLSAKERAIERRAAAEERAKLVWLAQSPYQIASRVPNSVFALGAFTSGCRDRTS